MVNDLVKYVTDLKPTQYGCAVRTFGRRNGHVDCSVSRNGIPYGWMLRVDAEIYDSLDGKLGRAVKVSDILEEMRNRGQVSFS
jgi:hypothetical protein